MISNELYGVIYVCIHFPILRSASDRNIMFNNKQCDLFILDYV